MRSYTIPVLAGDGIGPEVIAEGIKVLDAASRLHDFRLDWKRYPHNADYYLERGELLSPDVLRELAQYKAIYFGACGDERVPPGVLEKGLVLAIRNFCDQYVNLRPVKLLAGIEGPLRGKSPADIDFVVVRENTEDFYIAAGGRARAGRTRGDIAVARRLYNARFALEVDTDADEIAYQFGILSRAGCRRVIRYAFELARRRRKHVSLVDKANVLTEIYSFWREQFREIATEYPDVRIDFYLVDAACMWFLRSPEQFDVVLAPNMFGDIITEVGATIQGGLGVAPGANLNPEGTGMFEPIHGSAPPFKGLQRANPIATIWAGAMLLDFLGEKQAAAAVLRAIEMNLQAGKVRTPDLGGASSTAAVGDDVAARVAAASEVLREAGGDRSSPA